MATTLPVEAIETHLNYFIGTDHVFEMTDVASQDMDGLALSFMIKKRATDDDEDAILTYTVGNGVSVADAVVSVSVDSDDTDEFRAGIYHWELKCMDPGAEGVYGFGTFTMKRGVHHG